MNYMAQFRSVSLSVPKVQRAKKEVRPNVVYQCQRMNSDKQAVSTRGEKKKLVKSHVIPLMR